MLIRPVQPLRRSGRRRPRADGWAGDRPFILRSALGATVLRMIATHSLPAFTPAIDRTAPAVYGHRGIVSSRTSDIRPPPLLRQQLWPAAGPWSSPAGPLVHRVRPAATAAGLISQLRNRGINPSPPATRGLRRLLSALRGLTAGVPHPALPASTAPRRRPAAIAALRTLAQVIPAWRPCCVNGSDSPPGRGPASRLRRGLGGQSVPLDAPVPCGGSPCKMLTNSAIGTSPRSS